MYAKATTPISFIVDPQRDGGISNALWKEVNPTIAVSSNKFRFNQAEGLIRADVKFGRFEFSMNMPITAAIGAAALTTGEGLDDATSGGTYSGTTPANGTPVTYTIEIDGTGTPDTFSWYIDGVLQVAAVEITASSQALGDDGVTVTFGATTGHTSGDIWTISVTGDTTADFNGDVEFGLKNLSLGTVGKISVLADQSEDTFSFITYDIFGTAETTAITWDTDWNNQATRFIIEWFNDRVRLLVLNNGDTSTRVLAEHKTRVGTYSLNPFIRAVGNDNVDVDYIIVDNAQQNSIMLI